METPSTQNSPLSLCADMYSTKMDTTAATMSTTSISSQIASLNIKNNDFFFLFLYSFNPYLSAFYFVWVSDSPRSADDLKTATLSYNYFAPYLLASISIEFRDLLPRFIQNYGYAFQRTIKLPLYMFFGIICRLIVFTLQQV